LPERRRARASFDAAETISVAPEFVAVRLDKEMQAAVVRELVRFGSRLGALHIGVGERHVRVRRMRLRIGTRDSTRILRDASAATSRYEKPEVVRNADLIGICAVMRRCLGIMVPGRHNTEMIFFCSIVLFREKKILRTHQRTHRRFCSVVRFRF
jgi:hypothetical protein